MQKWPEFFCMNPWMVGTWCRSFSAWWITFNVLNFSLAEGCDSRQQAVVLSEQLLTTALLCCRMSRHGCRHADLSVQPPSCSVVCLTATPEERACLLVSGPRRERRGRSNGVHLSPPRWTPLSAALVVSVRFVYNEPQKNAVIRLDVTISQLSAKFSSTSVFPIRLNIIINISPKGRCCMLQ